MLATLDAQHDAFDARVGYNGMGPAAAPHYHARALWPTLVCVTAHYPLTTRTTTGPFLARPARLADTVAGTRAGAMRREVQMFDGVCHATETAAAVADHLVARAAMMRIDATHATYLANAGILEIWGGVRAGAFRLSWWFETVETERARVARTLYRSWPSSWLVDCHFHPEVSAVDFAETVLLARRLCEELSVAAAAPPLVLVPVAGQGSECAVCMDAATDPVRVPCSHVFCARCITAWLSVSTARTCPVCRCVFA
jgi:hypothetical protein